MAVAFALGRWWYMRHKPPLRRLPLPVQQDHLVLQLRGHQQQLERVIADVEAREGRVPPTESERIESLRLQVEAQTRRFS